MRPVESLQEAKRRLPLPELLNKIRDGARAKRSARCPFHEDLRNSFSVFKTSDGTWLWKCFAGCGAGDGVDYLERRFGLSTADAITRYCCEAGVLSEQLGHVPMTTPSFNWPTCVDAVTTEAKQDLAAWRGLSLEFVDWIHRQGMIGLCNGNVAFPVHDKAGRVISCHVVIDRESRRWAYWPKGKRIQPFVFGDSRKADYVLAFESQWDAFAVMDRLDWHTKNGLPRAAVLITRGAQNGKLIAGRCVPDLLLYAFVQNDQEKDGLIASELWLADIATNAGCTVLRIVTPAPYKDPNDWLRAGMTAQDIMGAIQDAKLVAEPVTFDGAQGGENVENVQNESPSIGQEDPASTFSTVLTRENSLSLAIYPESSWFGRYMDFAREREESADSYLIGAILPVVAAALARRIRFPWGEGWIYANLFTMLAGKPGDRKSSAINLAERMARAALSRNCFLPDSLSVEALFNEYDEGSGGCPDKLLIADDANPFLGLLRKSNYGERVGDLLLRLFDCNGLAESFQRNKTGENPSARRCIEETSTSICFGATFNVCQFQGQEIRTGLQRRFNYYLADGHGRFLVLPARSDSARLLAVTGGLEKLATLPNTDCGFTPQAAELWETFQRENRRQLSPTESTPESQLARLNGQPTHVLKLAMIFQAALWAELSHPFTGLLDRAVLETAIKHSDHCIAAAQALDSIGNRAAIQSDADVLLANVQRDFASKSIAGQIVLTRTDLTSRYAHHSGRRGALSPDDLYLRLIPDLIRRRKANEVSRPGKQSSFAFKVEEGE